MLLTWRLRSFSVATCDVSRTRTSLGDRSFTAAGPRLRNNLPFHLHDSELALLELRRLLKTHLFECRSRRLVTDFDFNALCKKCSYLRTCTTSGRNVSNDRRKHLNTRTPSYCYIYPIDSFTVIESSTLPVFYSIYILMPVPTLLRNDDDDK